MKSTSFKSLVMVGLLAAAGATMAQPGSAQGGGMRERMDPAKMDAMVAKRHDALKTQLKLTAEQEPAWTTFTTAMKPANRAEMKRPDRAELDKLPTPERIDKMRALRNERMAAMNAEMDKREDATKANTAARAEWATCAPNPSNPSRSTPAPTATKSSVGATLGTQQNWCLLRVWF